MTQKSTINGLPVSQARMRGELTNATDYTHAEIPVLILGDYDEDYGHYSEAVVHVRLRQGYGSESHLFDRAAATIAAAIEGRMFASAAKAAYATRAVNFRESLGIAVEVDVDPSHRPVSPELREAADAIYEPISNRRAAARLKKLVKEVKTLQAMQIESGRFVLSTPAMIAGRYAYQFAATHAPASGFCSPMPTYATAEEAIAARDAFLARIEA